MNRAFTTTLVLAATLSAALPSAAQSPRKDVIWARSTAGATITMDGVLDEPAWAAAESSVILFGMDAGIPGSGWRFNGGIAPSDPSKTTIRFLRDGNQLWMGAVVRDKSVGGQKLWERWDGLLMAIKDHANASRPSPPSEYFYSWWYPEDSLAAVAPGALPRFRGRWTGCSDNPSDCARARTQQEMDAWNAVTVVHGISNDDNTDDWGYVVEMRFDVSVMGYDFNQPGGDAVEWNISIYDCDWFWPFQPTFSSNRVWWQDPWGNDAWYHNVRVYGRSDVTINSGAAPTVAPDVRIPAADNFAAPVMDGVLTDEVWQSAPHFDIRYGDALLRNSYPGMGPWRSGQYQPMVNARQASVLNPGDGTVRWFFKGDKLYVGFDVRDNAVQYIADQDRWDGFTITLNDYAARGSLDNQILIHKYSFQVSQAGGALAQHELPQLIGQNGAEVALALKAGTTVDTTGQTADAGYTAELWIDLTKVGYPIGRGDGRIFLGIDLLDGDSYTPFTLSYATRTWWQRETGNEGGGPDGPAWGYLDPLLQVVGVEDDGSPVAARPALLGIQPNPFAREASISFTLVRPSDVTLEVYDLRGRRLEMRSYGRKASGSQQIRFDGEGLESGLYLYRLQVREEGTGAKAALAGKMILVR